MKETAQQIRKIIEEASVTFTQIDDQQAGVKSIPDKWSKKEILGHLIDSAANNHQRFVRAGYNAAKTFPPYNQNEWVQIQAYNGIEWQNLINFWAAYNFHLCHIIENLPNGLNNTPCNIGEDKPVSLEFVITDYLRHLRHHVEQITNY